MISAASKLCAVIGDPVSHSMSPQIHNSAFQECGVDMAYVAFHVAKGDVGRALDGVRSLGIRGLSVTIPHKMDIIPFLDEVEEEARNDGSVNTVVNEGGRLVGHSTDGPGALRALAAEGVEPEGKDILLLGSGGAARAVAFSFGSLDPLPRLTILGVVPDELDELGADLGEKTRMSVATRLFSSEELAKSMARAEIVTHATPVGMSPKNEESLVPRDLIRSNQVVFDIVYNPLQTRLLKEAAEAGATPVAGLGMFVHQAAIQFELWTGIDAPVELMTKTVRKALGG